LTVCIHIEQAPNRTLVKIENQKSKTSRRFYIAGGILILLLILASVIGSAWFRSWLRSDEFRSRLSREVSYALGVEGEFSSLSWQGASLYSESFDAEGFPGQGIRALQALHIRAEFDLRALFRGRWRIHAIDIQKVDATIDPYGEFHFSQSDRRPRLLCAGIAGSGDGDPGEVGHVVIHDLSIHTVPELDAMTLDDLQLEIESEGEAWRIRGKNGLISTIGYPAATLKSCDISFLNGNIECRHLELALENDQGHASVSGTVQPAGEQVEEGDVNLEVKLGGLPVSLFLNEDWRARVAGFCEGTFRLRGPLTDGSEIEASGQLSVVHAVLEALPVLNQISTFTGSEQFRRIRLSTAQARISARLDRLTATEIVAESPGLLRIEGMMGVHNHWMEGRFEVGVAPEHLRWIPGAQTRVFVEERNGYRWADMKISGPSDSPNEDLSGRLLSAAGSEIMENTGDVVEQGIERAAEFLEEMFR